MTGAPVAFDPARAVSHSRRIRTRALWAGVFAGAWLLAGQVLGGVPALRVIPASAGGRSMLQNGGFEAAPGAPNSGSPGWNRAPQGHAIVAGEGRNGSSALRCENRVAREWVGASQTVVLNRTNPVPLVVRGWSRARNVSGGSDSDYSLYVDLLYDDGSPLWGRTVNFRAGTHDWEKREFVIYPERPVRQLTVHCLMRNHTGTAWFDDIEVAELRADGDAVLFQGVPVMVPPPVPNQPEQAEARVATQDGLQLGLRAGRVASLRLPDAEYAAGGPSGFLARDVATGSDFFPFSQDECPDLRLKLRTTFRAEAERITIEGRVTDVSGRDRAITLLFALPIDASGWLWGDDPRRSRVITGRTEYANTVGIQSGSTGTLSQYPLAVISRGSAGLALGIDLEHPAQYRLGYHPATKQFLAAFDFGLVPETANFPSSADFRLVLFRFDGRWGFRSAWAKFMRLFPDHFVVRSKEQGIWMPFTDVSTVRDWADFGFKYHEGNNNVPWDDEHGVLSFRYTEPMTWWMAMPPQTPRTGADAHRRRAELAAGSDAHARRMAQVAATAGMQDAFGEPPLLFRNEPWCNGAIWSLNPNPALPTTPAEPFNAATVYWNPEVKRQLYGPDARGKLDGEYLDSLEGYVTADLNFRRAHFQSSTVPLTFASDTCRPALHKGLAVFEFTRWLAQDVHGMGKLMFANGVPYRFAFLCPWLDVLGTETDWLYGGEWAPAPDRQMVFWRAMSGAKPYVILMNTDYNALRPELVERYFQRCLFYGMFPSMFSHNASENPYWQNPAWYDRDRPLFKRYIPLIKQIAEAGWQPVTAAQSGNQRILVERFGPGASRKAFFTLLNDSGSSEACSLRFDPDFSPGEHRVRELLSGAEVALEGGALALTFKPFEAKVLTWGN